MRQMVMAHSNQDESDDMNLFHLLGVARLLFDATDGTDTELVNAGLLHHVFESECANSRELIKDFGVGISDLLTEVRSMRGAKASRTAFQGYDTGKQCSRRAKLLIVADLTSQLGTPGYESHYSLDTASQLAYFDREIPAMDVSGNFNSVLREQFDELCYTRFARLQASLPMLAQRLT